MKKRLPLHIVLPVLTGLLWHVPAAAAEDIALLPLADSKQNRITVPQRALVLRNGIPGVFVLHDGEARFRMVRPGQTILSRNKKQVVVLSGLFGNETLILGETQQLYDGMPIESGSRQNANGNP